MIRFEKRMLSNGMRILHHYDSMTRMVAVNLMYGVGSRNEREGKTGLAHLFEHLMFSGSEHAPSFDQPIQAAGGESNAWTSVDFTNYYEVLPSQNIETALWLESDRLTGLKLDESSIETQRRVVIEEFKQRCLNVPYGDLNHMIHRMAYRSYPYKWPTLGASVEDVEHLQPEEIVEFFKKHYAVNNLVMCISGNIGLEQAMELAEKWFGDIPSQELDEMELSPEPAQNELRRETVKRDVPQDLIYMAFHMCGRMDPDFVACDMISDMLANGMSSRFTQNVLAKNDVFTELDAAVEGTQAPGLFLVRGKLSPKADIHRAEAIIREELRRMTTEPVSSEEIQKCINKYQSTLLFENVGYLQKATRLCQYEMSGDVEMVNREVELYRAITPDDIARVSNQLFADSNASIIHYQSN